MARCGCSGANCDQFRGCISAGPGLDYDGDTGVMSADVSTWPFACSMVNGGGIYSDPGSGGLLRGEPMPRGGNFAINFDTNYPNVTVPVGATTVAQFPFDVTNTDPCRDAHVVIARMVDVFFTLPAGSGAASLSQGDEVTYAFNNGGTSQSNVHTSTTTMNNFVIPAGATLNFTNNVGVSRGSGGAVYTRIQAHMRVWTYSLPT